MFDDSFASAAEDQGHSRQQLPQQQQYAPMQSARRSMSLQPQRSPSLLSESEIGIDHSFVDDNSNSDTLDLSVLTQELRQSTVILQQQHLMFAARWAAELLTEHDEGFSDEEQQLQQQQPDSSYINQYPLPPQPHNRILLALTYMQLHEYQRAAWLLREQSNSRGDTVNSDGHSVWLRLYSQYLAYSQRKDELSVMQSKHNNSNNNSSGGAHTPHPTQQLLINELFTLHGDLQLLLIERGASFAAVHTAALWYLYALCCKALSSNNSSDDINKQPQPLHLDSKHSNNSNSSRHSLASDSFLQQSRYACVRSINLFSCNWSAWKLLTSLCSNYDAVVQLCERGVTSSTLHGKTTEPQQQQQQHNVSHNTSVAAADEYIVLTSHWYRRFWLCDVLLELHSDNDNSSAAAAATSASSLTMIHTLAPTFSNSSYLLQQTAIAHYHQREFESAQQLFEAIRAAQPYRLEALDIYSNVLYVLEARAALSSLAHWLHQHHRYTAVTCVVLGNYYSLRAEHQQAVLFFSRAIALDPLYLSAWTLMGHEYIELRNTTAAVACYRQAVNINSSDYRAYYGLGQAYEILGVNSYALYYFRKAVALRPYDARMWCALGESYSKISSNSSSNNNNSSSNSSNTDYAIKAYLRAVGNNDREGIAVLRLARLYRYSKRDAVNAAKYYRLVLVREGETVNDSNNGNNSNSTSVNNGSAVYDESNTDMDTSYIGQQQQQLQQQQQQQQQQQNQGSTLSPEATEAIQFLAEHHKQLQQHAIAALYVNRLLEVVGGSNSGGQQHLQHNDSINSNNNHNSSNNGMWSESRSLRQGNRTSAATPQQQQQQQHQRTPRDAA